MKHSGSLRRLRNPEFMNEPSFCIVESQIEPSYRNQAKVQNLECRYVIFCGYQVAEPILELSGHGNVPGVELRHV